jgi:phage repressor protein C with HTH and peptisase S24 domain
MLPTLREGQVVLVFMSRNFHVGDVVVAFMDRREVVKRITKMRDDAVFLEGDNSKESTDSKTHGWLADRHLLGRVIFPVVKKRLK